MGGMDIDMGHAGCLAEPTLDGMGGMDMYMGHGLGPANWTTDCGDVALVAEEPRRGANSQDWHGKWPW